MNKVELLSAFIPEEQNFKVLEACLESAKTIILSRRFPFLDELPDRIESRYENLQIRIAVEIYNRRGAEGESAHNENGINRTYENAGISKSLLDEITPYCGVVK